ncbi:MAG: cytochrome c [Bacteroidales bacterium]|nr:cytochrome c [Bacteroidales bacterium]MCB8999685.1 cytochrome c [Bacteroidales bacterium]MCB9000308.1 cytochrome c [Bacteroidales bacterium]
MKLDLKYLSGLLILLIVMASCDRDRNHPGWDYFPDMFYSLAYETYSPNPNFADGKTMREPVKGTVSREITVFPYTLDEGERVRAGNELINPIEATHESVERGKHEFTVFCIGCHGADGNGDGHLYTSGLYKLKPRSLVGDEAKKLKDGEIYYSITLGFGSMGPHGAMIRPDDRWNLINYIREDLQKNFKGISDTLVVQKN